MKIVRALPVLIITCLVLMAAEKVVYGQRHMLRCGQPRNIPAAGIEPAENISKRTFNLINEKDILFRFIPSYSKFY